ncbi:hypothetical protein NECAME_10893 [Necator americanus]|uniref:Uncharacterized protein n=1 Tax=Necator americanus TaxID=51031 RepID=W2T6K4_NECAM|nr:hypothetical protein NECAME_10893 [Necator americanus]ETN77645.1 hypothetical protein NECAME_10893 [Necator americanus]
MSKSTYRDAHCDACSPVGSTSVFIPLLAARYVIDCGKDAEFEAPLAIECKVDFTAARQPDTRCSSQRVALQQKLSASPYPLPRMRVVYNAVVIV